MRGQRGVLGWVLVVGGVLLAGVLVLYWAPCVEGYAAVTDACWAAVTNNHLSQPAMGAWGVGLALTITALVLRPSLLAALAALVALWALPVIQSGYAWTGWYTADTNPGAYVFTGVFLALAGGVLLIDGTLAVPSAGHRSEPAAMGVHDRGRGRRHPRGAHP